MKYPDSQMMGVIWLPPIFFINCYIENIWEDTPDRHLARWQGLRTWFDVAASLLPGVDE